MATRYDDETEDFGLVDDDHDPAMGGASAMAAVEDPADSDPVDITLRGRLLANMQVLNLAPKLKDTALAAIGERVIREAEVDEDSRKDWRKRTLDGMRLAMQKGGGAKNWPWPGASNVQFPLLTTAAMQFAARAYPAIVPSPDVVKGRANGKDPDGAKAARADRVAKHISWQCLDQMPEWEPDTDRMCHAIPIAGCAFKKTYWDGERGQPRSEYCSALDIIVNQSTRSVETAPRITHRFKLYPHEIEERIRAGTWRAVELGRPEDAEDDEDAPHWFYEQHRRLDLDLDGYPEPVIVTVHCDTGEVVRIVANYVEETIFTDGETLYRIDPQQYFTLVPFIPNPEGGFYPIGFAWLLAPINDAVNSLINQLIDAGTLANTGGGFVGQTLKMRGGALRFVPGEFKSVEMAGGRLGDHIHQLTFAEPSQVLFALLGMLIDAGRDISGVKDVLMGEVPSSNIAQGTVLAMIEQGMKQFTAIYKRMHAALKSEFRKIFLLNRAHLDDREYALFHGETGPEIYAADYQAPPEHITPFSDPTQVTPLQAMARAEYLNGFLGRPSVNERAITRRQLEAAGIDDVEDLMAPEDGPPPPQVVLALREAVAKVQKLYAEIGRLEAQRVEQMTKSVKNVADAEAAEVGVQLDSYRAEVGDIRAAAEIVDRARQSEQQAEGGGA